MQRPAGSPVFAEPEPNEKGIGGRRPRLSGIVRQKKERLPEHGVDESRGGIILPNRRWPPWWNWELELGPHLLKRMIDRRFTEVELRRMLQYARNYHKDVVESRWVIETSHRKWPWEVIVEPDFQAELLVVITAYPCEEESQ